MRRRLRTTRWLLTAGLILAMGLTGVLPHLMGPAEGIVRAADGQQSSKCCCGTADGRCCGTGCCAARQAPAKESWPGPSQQESRGGQNGPMAVAMGDALFVPIGGATGLHSLQAEDAFNRSLAESSLQAQHVRIDA